MPLYAYACDCGHKQDEWRRIEDRNDAPEHCGKPMARELTAHMVNMDIQPYRAVAVDKHTGKCPVINSRKEHREFLKRNGYEEIGSEPVENLMKHEIRKTHPLERGTAPTVSNINLAPQE